MSDDDREEKAVSKASHPDDDEGANGAADGKSSDGGSDSDAGDSDAGDSNDDSGDDDSNDDSEGSDDDEGSDDEDDDDDEGSEGSGSGEEKTGEGLGGDNDDTAGFTTRRKRGTKKLKARAQRRAAAAGKDAPEKPPSAGVKRKRGEGCAKKAKKAKASGGGRAGLINRYMDLEVEEAGEGEEEEGERLGKRARGEEAAATKAAYERIRAEDDARREKMQRAKTAEQIAEDIERREKEMGYLDRDDYEDVEAEGAGLLQQAHLPGAADPKLWMLRCKPGAEAEILVTLCNKTIALSTTPDRLAIMSAVSTQKGVVFVEAFREAQVRAAVTNIRDLYGWKPDAIQLVPIAEMTNVLNVAATRHVFRKNEFVRMAQGVYKGDLAQVLDVFEGGSRLLIRCVPRLDMAALSVAPGQRRGFRGGRGGVRPPQRFFDKDAVMEASNGTVTIETRRKYGGMLVDMLKSHTFKDGMLIKEVRPIAVDPHGPPPTMDEIAKFRPQKSRDNDDDDAMKSAETQLLESLTASRSMAAGKSATMVAGVASSDAGRLLPGDAVIVVKGDLANLAGKVVAVNGDTFTMHPTGRIAEELGIKDRIEMPCDEVLKTFEPGDRVKILGGAYIAETGMVVKLRHKDVGESNDQSTAWLAVVLLDSGHKQVEVFVRDLTRTADVRAAVEEVEGYHLHDLVEIPGIADQNDAGVIISLSQRDVTVLLTTGIVKQVPVQQLRGKLNHRSFESTAVDSMSNPLSIGDVVKTTLPGETMPTTGTIKHIYRGTLFLHDFKRPANAGMFVSRTRFCTLAGTKVRAPGTIQASNPATMRMGGRGKTEDNLTGKTVRITSGTQKGKIGIVKSVTFSHAFVELHATQKTVSLKKEFVTPIGDRMGQLPVGRAAEDTRVPATPFIGASSAAYGGAFTPAMGSHMPMTPYAAPTMTPMAPMTPGYSYGSMTPMVGGMGDRTPMMYASQTPLVGGQTPMLAPQTPLMPSQTPVHAGAGARTPAGAPLGVAYGGMSHGADEAPWYAPGVYVSVAAGLHTGKRGIIQAVQGGGSACTVQFEKVAGPPISVPTADLRPRLPAKAEYCRFTKGAFAGTVGFVVTVSGEESEQDFVCRVGHDLSENGEIEIFSPNALVACAPPS